jgi:hypothetical protein
MEAVNSIRTVEDADLGAPGVEDLLLDVLERRVLAI